MQKQKNSIVCLLAQKDRETEAARFTFDLSAGPDGPEKEEAVRDNETG